jgi:hypothetical protein
MLANMKPTVMRTLSDMGMVAKTKMIDSSDYQTMNGYSIAFLANKRCVATIGFFMPILIDFEKYGF